MKEKELKPSQPHSIKRKPDQRFNIDKLNNLNDVKINIDCLVCTDLFIGILKFQYFFHFKVKTFPNFIPFSS